MLYTKNLECSCIKETSVTCPGGGEVNAFLTATAAISSFIESESSVTNPGETLTANLAASYSGSGPYYTISGCVGDNCQYIEEGWEATITGLLGAVPYSYTVEIKTVFSDGSYLIFSTDLPSPDEPTNEVLSVSVSGVGYPTLPKIIRARDTGSTTLEFQAEIDSILSSEFSLDELLIEAEGELEDGMTADYSVVQDAFSDGTFDALDADKIYGDFGEFYCLEKLYPKRDLNIDAGFAEFSGFEDGSPLDSGIYETINEGVYEGILKDGGDSLTLSDDGTSYITPDTVHTEGFFQYKCELTNLNVRPEQTAFRMRVSAPLQNYESSIAPLYTVYNIRLLDPSGSLIVKYNDLQFRGDSDETHPNYSTLSSLPETNVVTEQYDWERLNSPLMQEVSGYSLSFSVRAVALDDPFDPGFNKGFEENYIIPETFDDDAGNTYLALDGQPLSTQESNFINPTNGFRISAVEICNSGGYGPRIESFLPIYTEVRKKGFRLERKLLPRSIFVYDHNNNVHPSVDSLWEKTNRPQINNQDECGAKELVQIIKSNGTYDSITLSTAEGGGVADSGKLIVKFGGCWSDVDEISKGAFNFQFDQGTKNIWFSPSGAFNVENRREDIQKDSIFYHFETMTLKVLAKKEVGSRDYFLDVVGYSDDKLLHNTPASGGYIQDPSGVYLNDLLIEQEGQFPVISGTYSSATDWVLGGAALSERENYYEASGNDHYKLAQYPVVTGTDFNWYEVPLTVVDNRFRLGLERDYKTSSLLENVHLDIYPIPSGASIAALELCVRYAPQNALNFYTQGSEKFEKVLDGRSEGSLYPTRASGSNDDFLNAGSGYNPISRITGLPHDYSSPDTLKTNYSRRWRGVKATVRGPYDPDMFNFGFENPTMDYPFLSGYFKFENVTDKYVQSTYLGDELGQASGLLFGDPKIYQNVGWRFASGTLFERQLPDYSGNYTSTDWTALSKGSTTFVGNPMYGKIADAFDRVIRISGEAGNQYVNFGNIDTVSGFSIFLRFTPDANVSGQNYDLFESGALISQWDTPSELGFALGYEGGFLTAYSKDDDGNLISVQDTANYYDYTYPLSVLVTYNDNYSKKLKLYVDSEDAPDPWNVKREESVPFDRLKNNSDIILGYAAGSGIGMNMLVSEFGISTYSSGVDTLYGSGTNIVENNSDLTYKQVTAKDVMDDIRAKFFNPDESPSKDRYKLWDRVNENTYTDWVLGDFKYCEFNYMFSNLGSAVGKRSNYEHLVFSLKHHGSGYSQYNDNPLLTTVNSGVAYHTQMENDFLRFHLSDVPENFYAVNRRITKNLPCGYKFSENAIVVESVIEHTVGTEDIQWSGCNETLYGPKMIVSLYTKKQEPYWTPDEPNWGLVNRRIHYIEPSSCIFRADSTFTLDDICDETEAWSIFPREPRLKDFDERYFSDDVNDMFVQYDLVYPSGRPFESRIQLHSSHIRMEDANICSTLASDSVPLNVSGNFPAEAAINLNIGGFPRPASGVVPLNINVPLPLDVLDSNPSGLVLNVKGGLLRSGVMPLSVPEYYGPITGPGVDPESPDFDPSPYTVNLNINGIIPDAVSGTMTLSMPNVLGRFDSSFDNNPSTSPGSPNAGGGSTGTGGDIGSGIRPRPIGMNLTLFNSEVVVTPSGPMLSLNMIGSDFNGVTDYAPLMLGNKIPPLQDAGSDSAEVNLMTLGGSPNFQTRFTGKMPMFIKSPNILKSEVPLYIHNPIEEGLDSGSMPLYTVSYPVGSKGFGSAYGLWDGNSYGTGIELEDNKYLSISAANEIRGLDLFGYGTCTGNSPNKAFDEELKTDCFVWRERTCNEGGIFRATDTYTNSGAINFSEYSDHGLGFDDDFESQELGYSGNYYGARKYTQLLPSLAYNTVVTIKTGDTDPINIPRTFEEWEYGMCGSGWKEFTTGSGCCTEDCDQSIVFSGFKFVGDDSNLATDPELLVESGRCPSGNFGETVKVRGNLMAIGSPNLTIPDFDPLRGVRRATADGPISLPNPGLINVSGAGAVFLYRRDTDVAGKKAPWQYTEQLMLPTGYRKDFIEYTAQNLLRFDNFSISGQKWGIGQEGRQFGESLAICSSGDREVVAVGAPRAKWSREFIDIPTSGIEVSAFLVTDLFQYDKKALKGVAGAAQRFNVLWKYFTPPWNPGPNQWFPQLTTKVIVVQLTFSDKDYPNVPKDEADWFTHKYIPRLDDLDLLLEIGEDLLGPDQPIADYVNIAQPIVFNQMFSGVKDAFFTAHPSGRDLRYKGIPPILGMFREQTGSTAGGLQYRNAFSGKTYNLYDELVTFYEAHSYASGVKDFVQNIAQSGHVNSVIGKSEDVYATSRNLIFNTFDSGRLSRTFTNTTLNRDFIASGVDQIWGKFHGQTANQFQVPPGSGGRVFLFEKERDNFNCIQVMSSPNDEYSDIDDGDDEAIIGYGREYNDRFGHSLAISKNGEILTIGNPWQPKPARIYERNEDEAQKVYTNIRAWLVQNNKTDAVLLYDKVLQVSGDSQAQISAYDYLNSSERFGYRNDYDFWGTLPQPYTESYSYGYGDIKYVGTRKFLASEFAPTSRLGWSTAANDDGDIVAFGAPTDSFNEFEDVNVWGDFDNTWASYQHAGAVRIFKSRQYYPHNKVVEFGLFGNLDRNTHDEERNAGYYDVWDEVFSSGSDGTSDYQAKQFRRMDFSEIEIPRDAGLCFITTPEIDAASDEVIQNIKDWLALGDRNLVLVGNDPEWEDAGLYKESNGVINKILNKLDSRMRIFAAKDESYASQGTLSDNCVPQSDIGQDKFNVTKSFTPFGSAGTTISQDNYYGKGFGDIRIDLSQDRLESYEEYFECPEGICCGDCDGPPPIVNNKCEFPLKHHGDLRAQWIEQCVKTTPNGCKVVSYTKNWPFQFNNFEPNCDDPPVPMFRKARQEPVPVLTTMEHLPPSSWYIPATSGKFCEYRTIYEYRIKESSSTEYTFASKQVDNIEFSLQESDDSNPEGIFNSFTYNGDFVDPDTENGRDCLLQGFGRSFYPEDEERTETRVVYPESILGLVESGRKDDGTSNKSRVYLFGSQWSEDDASRGLTFATLNDDKNTEFYINMLRRDCVYAPKGRQINGFTGRNSLNDAYYLSGGEEDGHNLADKLAFEFSRSDINDPSSTPGYFYENQTLDDIQFQDDFIWIAHPSGKPSESDLNKIKTWMGYGNKKVIITYNAADPATYQDIADNVDYLCSGLNITSRPMFLPKAGEYFRTDKIITGYKREDDRQIVNYATDSVSGCDFGYDWTDPNYQFATSLSGIDFNPGSNEADGSGDEIADKRYFVPLSGGQDYEKIIWWSDDVTEQYTVYPNNRYKIDGESTISFPTEEGSGYRMFINFLSEKESEKFKICGDLEGVKNGAEPPLDEGFDEEPDCIFFPDDDGEGEIDDYSCNSAFTIGQTEPRNVQTRTIDFRACGDEVILDIASDLWSSFIPNNLLIDGVLPATPRLLSISGCFLPINESTTVTRTSGKFPIGRELIGCEYIVNPAQSGTVPGDSRPVKHKSGPAGYCPPNGFSSDECREANFGSELIEDGPVVLAVEKESFSSFPAGRNRSRIIVISDSTMIQGQCPSYRASATSGNQDLIRSLYPLSPEDFNGPGEDSEFGVGEGSINGINTRNWYFSQKLRGPERGSPAKYSAVSGDAVSNMVFDKLYGGGGPGSDLSLYVDNEDVSRDPTVTTGRPAEIRDPAAQEARKKAFGDSNFTEYGMYFRFSGDFLNILANPADPECYEELLGQPNPEKCTEYILDAGIGGGMNDLMKINNTDYLDLDVYYSGCLGDLFGYSLDMDKDQIIVGTPFNGYYTEGAVSGVSGIVQWHEIQNDTSRSGMRVAEDGGAGAAFVYQETNNGENLVSEFLPFEWIAKIKPSSLNVGIYDFTPSPDVALKRQRGNHLIGDPSLIINRAKKSDNFGRSVSIDCDMVVVGAPHHDFQTLHHHIYSGGPIDPDGLNTAFLRKSFNAAFDIPSHSYYDLGSSGVRVDKFGNDSGVMILNAGAAYNYRNELVNFQTREKRWLYRDKIHAQNGYKGGVQGEWGPDPTSLDPTPPIIQLTSGNDFDNFGKYVCVDRQFRGDGDYTAIVGAPNHSWPVSGEHFSKAIENAGAAYSFDAMLREQVPSIPNSGGFIHFKVFSDRLGEAIHKRVYQNETGESQTYKFSGIVSSNYNGDIYLEVSGFDSSSKGFVAHRPYVDNIKFTLADPKVSSGNMNLFIEGEPILVSSEVPLSLLGADRANVYNSMNLYNFGVSGIVPSSMILFTAAPSGPITESLNLNLTSTQVTDNLNLRMRGF